MKNSRALIVLGLAMLAGLVAVVLAARWLTTRSAASSHIAVAAREIDLGTPLDATAVTTITWSGSALPDGAFTDAQAVQGRVVKTALARGEPILASKLAPAGARGGLSAAIGEGHRAITVRVNEVVGVAGFALPGSHVDVMVHTTVDDQKRGQGAPLSKIVLERILVLAVAQEASRDETRPKVVNAVTLEVTPAQAELLDVARSVGTLSLVLRNQIDRGPGGTIGMGKSDLFEGSVVRPVAAVVPPPVAAPAPAPARAPRRTPPTAAAAPVAPPPAAPVAAPAPPAVRVEVIRGVARSSVEL